MKQLNKLVLGVLLAVANDLNQDDASLRRAVEQFVEAADKSDSATVASMYAPDFVNVRVTDEGEVVRLDRVVNLQSGRRSSHPDQEHQHPARRGGRQQRVCLAHPC